MPCSIANSGSQTATLATTHTLATVAGPTGGGVYQLFVDVANLANGERLILTLETRARAADTTRVAWETTIEHAQAFKISYSPVVGVEVSNELIAKLRQENGTGRAFPWALKRLDA